MRQPIQLKAMLCRIRLYLIFDGKAVEGQKAMKYNTNASDKINITGTVSNDKGIVKNTEITFTVNGEKI